MWEHGRGDALLIPTRKKTFTAHKRRFPLFSSKKSVKNPDFQRGRRPKKSCEAFSYSNRPFLSSFRFPCFDIPAKGEKKENFIFLLLCKRETVGFRRCQSQVLHEEALCQFFCARKKSGENDMSKKKNIIF